VCLRAPPTISAFCAYVGWQISEFETSDEEALLKIRLVRPPPGTGGEDSDVRVPLRGYACQAPQPRARFNDLQERFWYSLRRSSQAKSTRRSWRSSRFDIADIAGSSSFALLEFPGDDSVVTMSSSWSRSASSASSSAPAALAPGTRHPAPGTRHPAPAPPPPVAAAAPPPSDFFRPRTTTTS
jgi:hypothetical protein